MSILNLKRHSVTEHQSMHKLNPSGRSPCETWSNWWLRLVPGALLATLVLQSGCHKAATPGAEESAAAAPSAAHANTDTGDKEQANEGVKLTSEQVKKLGVVAQTAQSISYSEQAVGYGVVVSHDTIAQATAELETAQATERLSRSALSRAKKLDGTPGALSADVEEAAAQKAEVDAAALTLTSRRLSSTLGMNPPWKSSDHDPLLQELAAGTVKLLRVTFPIGALGDAKPASLHAAHIGSKPGAGWTTTVLWDAPADATVPGRSFFALLKGSDAGEGERLQVWAPVGAATSGVNVPASAVVMTDGKYWCYIERKPGTFERVEINAARPIADGYFVTEGVGAGDKLVITAAGQLLAEESGSGSEPD
jgi:hypothetical protein